MKEQRYFFEVAYDGTNYAGWQSQKNARGIQAVIEDGLSRILRRTVTIAGSGRTDTGVHCEQQFFHADIPLVSESDLQRKLNSFLPKDIAIHDIRKVKQDAHARFAATERSYQYRICTRKDPFADKRALYYFQDLDFPTMNAATALLAGEHDFTCFSKVKTDVNSFVCKVKLVRWKKQDNYLYFDISANRFLRGMVRAVVGTLLEVGTGKVTLKEFKTIIASKDRKKAGANVAPHGLYLMKVKYPANIFIKTR